MDTYTGRRAASSGAWVAFGPARELAEHAARGDVIEVTTPTRNVARATITRVGHPFTRAGIQMAYAYLVDAAADGVE